MRGSYMQSFWSISTVSEGGLAVSLAPLVTCTQTFSSLPLFTRTEGSVMVFFAQYGSASRCSFPGVGALPPKSTAPSMVSAIAAAGRINAAMAAASGLEQVMSSPFRSEFGASHVANAVPVVKAWTVHGGRFFRSTAKHAMHAKVGVVWQKQLGVLGVLGGEVF